MRSFYFLICTLVFSSCHNMTFVTYKPSPYVKRADDITAKTAQKIKDKTGLRLCGTGGGMMDHIRMMAMCFDRYEEITMEEGRELLIYCVNEYLSAINASEELRPDLIHYPFTPKDVTIILYPTLGAIFGGAIPVIINPTTSMSFTIGLIGSALGYFSYKFIRKNDLDEVINRHHKRIEKIYSDD